MVRNLRRIAAVVAVVVVAAAGAQYTTVGGPDIAVPGCGNTEGSYNIVSGSGALGPDGRSDPTLSVQQLTFER